MFYYLLSLFSLLVLLYGPGELTRDKLGQNLILGNLLTGIYEVEIFCYCSISYYTCCRILLREFSSALQIVIRTPSIAGWVNRFAHAGDTAVEVAGTTALRVSYWLQFLLCDFISPSIKKKTF